MNRQELIEFTKTSVYDFDLLRQTHNAMLENCQTKENLELLVDFCARRNINPYETAKTLSKVFTNPITNP